MKDDKKLAKPFFKWVGGKTQIADKILDVFPSEIENYYEPFVGGGAMLFRVLQKYPNIKTVVINDLNRDVILSYTQVKQNITNLIEELRIIESDYNNVDDKQDFYYKRRTEFNELIKNTDTSLRRTVLFLFLNKTCFNGMYRVNRHGLFNTPYNYAKQIKFDYENLLACYSLLQNVKILCGNYSDALPQNDALVYFDPPYRPLNGSGEIGYTTESFNDESQIQLKKHIDKLSINNVKVVLSNSDTKDGFFDELYKDYSILRIQARRNINSNGNKRGCIDEILVKNF